jgi:flavin reductase (DIM6/NTAB) family NADH-FMN oxidoreductase RutF
MGKVLMGSGPLLYPTPTVLVGANIDGKPNFMTAAWCGIVNSEPAMISVAIQHHRYTHKGITQNLTFSVNIPSIEMVKETDYCGIISGHKIDKVEVCQFKVFYGKLDSAPLIEQCPVNLACKVIQMPNLGSHSLFIGRIEESYISESCFTDGKPDVDKIKPFAYIVSPIRQYRALGEVVAKAFSIGKKLVDQKIDINW